MTDKLTGLSLGVGDSQVVASTGLVLTATARADGAIFAKFFEGYDAAFVLPDEKEDVDGFRACLDLNFGDEHERLTREFGAFRELVLLAHDPSGLFIGGANFIALLSDEQVTANLNYIFIDKGARGRGAFRPFVASVRELVMGLKPGARDGLVFIEQNDPFAMSAEAYNHDTEFTGMDQFDRLRIWAKCGAKTVDFPYVQPPLSAEQEPDANLVYSVLGAKAGALPASVVRNHLRGFFGISVLKGEPIAENAAAFDQIEALARMGADGREISLLEPDALLARITSRGQAMSLLAPKPASFREALRASGAGAGKG